MLLNITLTLFFVFLNGFFVAAEFALVKIRMSQIELRIRAGSRIAMLARHLAKHLDAYLSATQLGITLASLGLGWIGESVVANMIIDVMKYFDLAANPEVAHKIALPIAFLLITVLHIVFGELAPKSLAIQRSEEVTMVISLPLRIFYFIFSPLIWILNSFANFIVRIVGLSNINEESELHSAEEIRYLLEESTRSGIINDAEHKMLENVFEFSETPVKQIMVPRNKIFAFDDNKDIDSLIDAFVDKGFSRAPVFKGNIDNIIGEVYAKDLLRLSKRKELVLLKDIIRPANFVNEEEKISVLLKNMQQKKFHIAIALNEFGGTAGLVTLEDILEEIVGEIQDEYDKETPLVEAVSENEFRIIANTTIQDINDYLPEPLPESDEYETLGGLINSYTGRIPEMYEVIEIDEYRCKIIQRTDQHIELIKLTLKSKIDNMKDMI